MARSAAALQVGRQQTFVCDESLAARARSAPQTGQRCARRAGCRLPQARSMIPVIRSKGQLELSGEVLGAVGNPCSRRRPGAALPSSTAPGGRAQRRKSWRALQCPARTSSSLSAQMASASSDERAACRGNGAHGSPRGPNRLAGPQRASRTSSRRWRAGRPRPARRSRSRGGRRQKRGAREVRGSAHAKDLLRFTRPSRSTSNEVFRRLPSPAR